MNMFEESPIVMVWLDHTMREAPLPPATLDTLLQVMMDEYQISPEYLASLVNRKPKRLKYSSKSMQRQDIRLFEPQPTQ